MIEFKDVYLQYGEHAVLQGVSFQIPDAKITAVLGPSGSGKSTIIKLMLGLIKATGGDIFIDGVNITKMKEKDLFPIRKKMGMVFQGNALFDSLTAEENLSFFLRENLKLDEEEIARRVGQMIKFAQLEGYEDQLPDTLSGGMKKRLAIGRALIFGPSMVLFDEPTVGLDPVSTKRILDVIHRLRADRGLGAVLVTHLIHDVETIADNVLILYQGKIVFNDVPDKMQESEHPFVASFLKHPEEIED